MIIHVCVTIVKKGPQPISRYNKTTILDLIILAANQTDISNKDPVFEKFDFTHTI